MPLNQLPRTLTERYNREAQAYRELWAPILRVAALRLLPELSHGASERVLDIGTGVGSLLTDLECTFPGACIVGVDRSPGMLARAPGQFGRAVMDAGHLGIATGTMDRVLMVFMLFHLSSPVDGLREAHRVLRGGGELGTVTWGGDIDSEAIRAWDRCLDTHGAEQTDPATVTRHDAVDTPEKMKALLLESGFGAARCWVDDLVYRFDAEHLIRLRTSLGAARPRFDSLAPEAQVACVWEARRRMNGMPSDAFVARAKIVYSVGRA